MSRTLTRRSLIAHSAAVAGGLLIGPHLARAARRRRVVVWSEGTAPKNVYPQDINGAVAQGLGQSLKGWEIVIASITDPAQGLPLDRLTGTDVLIWWGHQKHNDVKDELVDQIEKRVKADGMGFVALHSAHYSKPLKRLLGTPCGWKGGYVDDGSAVNVMVKTPGHPIARGVHDFPIPHTERYGEAFEVNPPDAVVFDGIYTRPDGTKEESRQGLVWRVGAGQVFYFQPGHESYPIFFQPEVNHILSNAVKWLGRGRK